MTTSRQSLINNDYYCNNEQSVLSLVYDLKNKSAFIVLEYIGKFDSFHIDKFQAQSAPINLITYTEMDSRQFQTLHQELDAYALTFHIPNAQVDYLINSIQKFDINVLTTDLTVQTLPALQRSALKSTMQSKIHEIQNSYLWARKKILFLLQDENIPEDVNAFLGEAKHVYDFSPSYYSRVKSAASLTAAIPFMVAETTLSGLYTSGKSVMNLLSLFKNEPEVKKPDNFSWTLKVILDCAASNEAYLLLANEDHLNGITLTTEYHKITNKAGMTTIRFNEAKSIASPNYYMKSYLLTEDEANHFMDQADDEPNVRANQIRCDNISFDWVKKIIVNLFPEEEDCYSSIDSFKESAVHCVTGDDNAVILDDSRLLPPSL